MGRSSDSVVPAEGRNRCARERILCFSSRSSRRWRRCTDRATSVPRRPPGKRVGPGRDLRFHVGGAPDRDRDPRCGLATVVVFAVRRHHREMPTRVRAPPSSRVLRTAQDVHWTLNGGYGDEAQLVATGAVREPSAMYDVTVDGSGGYAIDPAAGSACTESASGGTSSAGPPPPTAPPTTPAISPTVVNFHGVSGSYRYRPTSNGQADEIVIFGRAQGQADWVAMINAAHRPTPRRRRIAACTSSTSTTSATRGTSRW